MAEVGKPAGVDGAAVVVAGVEEGEGVKAGVSFGAV